MGGLVRTQHLCIHTYILCVCICVCTHIYLAFHAGIRPLGHVDPGQPCLFLLRDYGHAELVAPHALSVGAPRSLGEHSQKSVPKYFYNTKSL
jgi:hypothetical protein